MAQDPQTNPQPTAPSPAPAPASSAPAAAVPQRASLEAPPADTGPESPLWTGRTHWSHFLGSLVLWLAGAILICFLLARLSSRGTLTGGTAFKTAAFLLGASALVVGFRVLWKVLSCRYRLTTQRLFIERGIFSQTIDQTELVRVDDVRVRRTLIDRLLGLGAIEIISTDVSDQAVVVEGVRDPQGIAEHIRERMRQMRRKSLYVENL